MNKVITITLLSLSLMACSTLQTIQESMPWYSGNEIETIGLKVNYDASLQHAISVDIVFVYDENLQALLSGATAEQWFSQKNGYIASYGTNMDVIHREVVPGYSEFITELPDRHSDAGTVIAFAYYAQNPNAKALITELETPWLLFDESQMTVVSEAPITADGGQ